MKRKIIIYSTFPFLFFSCKKENNINPNLENVKCYFVNNHKLKLYFSKDSMNILGTSITYPYIFKNDTLYYTYQKCLVSFKKDSIWFITNNDSAKYIRY